MSGVGMRYRRVVLYSYEHAFPSEAFAQIGVIDVEPIRFVVHHLAPPIAAARIARFTATRAI